MACCIIAMLIIAHVMATLRRWGVFWGVVRPVDGEDTDTIFRRMRGWFARPVVRRAVLGMVAIEAVAVGSWLYFAHGTHIQQIGDQVIGALRGQTVVYADVCDKNGDSRTVRMVIKERDGYGNRSVETTI